MSDSDRQAFNVVPPRRGRDILPISVNSTAFVYDLSTVAMGFKTFREGDADDCIYLTLKARGGDVFYHFSNVNQANVADTSTISVGGSLAYSNAYADFIPQNGREDVRVNRLEDRYLVLKCASGVTATLHLCVSSQPGL